MYNVKYNPDGCVNKYKARLEAKSYAQTHDINYDETFVSVAKIMTMCVLTIVETKGSHLHQMDVKNVFLQGHLEEQVYDSAPWISIRDEQGHRLSAEQVPFTE